MKNNKKEFKKKVEKEVAKEKKVKAPNVYVELTPRFIIGDMVQYFMDTSTKIEKGKVVGVFVQPGVSKDYVYQVEYEFKNDKKEKVKGMCVPRSENVIRYNPVNNLSKIEKKVEEDLINRLVKINIKKLDDEIKDYKESLKMADNNIKEQNNYKKTALKIIRNLEKRKLEILKKNK